MKTIPSNPPRFSPGWYRKRMAELGDMKIRRPNGGHLWHYCPDGQHSAICGYAPSSPKGTMIWGRGCWADYKQGEPSCKGCRAKLGLTND